MIARKVYKCNNPALLERVLRLVSIVLKEPL